MKRRFSAGGVLVSKRRQIYLVHKLSRDEWVLPKGGIEEGESALEAAEREIKEETGYLNFREWSSLVKFKPFLTEHILISEEFKYGRCYKSLQLRKL